MPLKSEHVVKGGHKDQDLQSGAHEGLYRVNKLFVVGSKALEGSFCLALDLWLKPTTLDDNQLEYSDRRTENTGEPGSELQNRQQF